MLKRKSNRQNELFELSYARIRQLDLNQRLPCLHKVLYSKYLIFTTSFFISLMKEQLATNALSVSFETGRTRTCSSIRNNREVLFYGIFQKSRSNRRNRNGAAHCRESNPVPDFSEILPNLERSIPFLRHP